MPTSGPFAPESRHSLAGENIAPYPAPSPPARRPKRSLAVQEAARAAPVRTPPSGRLGQRRMRDASGRGTCSSPPWASWRMRAWRYRRGLHGRRPDSGSVQSASFVQAGSALFSPTSAAARRSALPAAGEEGRHLPVLARHQDAAGHVRDAGGARVRGVPRAAQGSDEVDGESSNWPQLYALPIVLTNGCHARKLPFAPALLIRRELAHTLPS